MRLRATGSTTNLASVSLKTNNKRAAMDAAEQLSGIVRAFHLENPHAPWNKLKEHFRCVSFELLGLNGITTLRRCGAGFMKSTQVMWAAQRDP
jgi:hypothetical protein